uniref:Ig-like domain-containing protein n=1 Tax=Spermophilus dauricus TaxID=99837 RepID=A0A8C9PIB8_SPEDA
PSTLPGPSLLCTSGPPVPPAPAGTHSLHYNLTVRSQGGSVQSSADGYWDHQLFLHYDSDSKESPKPQGPWAEKPLGTERWNTEIQELKEHIKKAKATLAEINAQQEQRGGSHSLQEIWGCKIEEDNRTRGFWMIYYDGEPFLSYHPETRSLRVEPSSAQTLAMEVKNSWGADGIQSKDIWAQVQGELCGKLRTYQSREVSPTVNVTCGETSEDTINVTCWACGFCPQNISVTWLQDGELLSQDTQDSVDVFPYGNGTYQTWLSTRIPQGQEQRFSCHVVHIGKNTTVPVSCGKVVRSVGLWKEWPIFLSVAVLLIMTVMIPVCVYCCKKSKTPSAAEASEQVSLQILDGLQRPPSDHTGSTQLGCQPLLRAPKASQGA